MSRIALALSLTADGSDPGASRRDRPDPGGRRARADHPVGRDCRAQAGARAAARAGADAVRDTLDALIARQLELAEANRYQPPEPPPPTRGAARRDPRAAPARPQALSATLAQSGLSEEQLRSRLRDDLRIEAFPRAALRLGPPALRLRSCRRITGPPGRLHDRGGVRPFSDVREAIRTQVSATQRATADQRMAGGSAPRTEIADLYVAARC